MESVELARPRKIRRVAFIPNTTHFWPRDEIPGSLEETVLTMEEFEAVRLKDLEELDQEDCAQRMGVSRPTFARVLDKARWKLADAVVSGKSFRIEGGDFLVIGQPAASN
jgi:uncharacterized protein